MSSKKPSAEYEANHGGGSNSNSAPLVAFGNTLPALDSETRNNKSYVPVWKQEVTEEDGRKRGYGAFTRGFSAGYDAIVAWFWFGCECRRLMVDG